MDKNTVRLEKYFYIGQLYLPQDDPVRIQTWRRLSMELCALSFGCMNKSEIEVFISKYSNNEWRENFNHNTYWSTQFNYLFKFSFTSKQNVTDIQSPHNNVQIEHLAPY